MCMCKNVAYLPINGKVAYYLSTCTMQRLNTSYALCLLAFFALVVFLTLDCNLSIAEPLWPLYRDPAWMKELTFFLANSYFLWIRYVLTNFLNPKRQQCYSYAAALIDCQMSFLVRYFEIIVVCAAPHYCIWWSRSLFGYKICNMICNWDLCIFYSLF